MAILGDIELWVVSQEVVDMTNDVTSRAVEKGVNIADHIKHQPVEISISAIIGSDVEDPAYADQIYQQLKQAWRSDKVFTYVGNLDKWDDMAITSVRPTRDNKNCEGFAVELKLKQVQVATAKTAEVPKNVSAQAVMDLKAVQPPAQLGQQQTKKAKTGGASELVNRIKRQQHNH
jgi:hypothetical protein